VTLRAGLAVPASQGDPAFVFFDRLGRPHTDIAGTEEQAGVRTLVTSSAGDVVILPETGYVP
jgi:hypothetical protein